MNGQESLLQYNEFHKNISHNKKIRTIIYYNTLLNHITVIITRHEFDSLAEQHHSGQKFRSFNRWSQVMAMIIGQLSSRKSLRDIIDNLKLQHPKLYHLGIKKTSRATPCKSE